MCDQKHREEGLSIIRSAEKASAECNKAHWVHTYNDLTRKAERVTVIINSGFYTGHHLYLSKSGNYEVFLIQRDTLSEKLCSARLPTPRGLQMCTSITLVLLAPSAPVRSLTVSGREEPPAMPAASLANFSGFLISTAPIPRFVASAKQVRLPYRDLLTFRLSTYGNLVNSLCSLSLA